MVDGTQTFTWPGAHRDTDDGTFRDIGVGREDLLDPPVDGRWPAT